MASKASITLDAKDLNHDLADLSDRVDTQIVAIFDYMSDRTVEVAKETAPWTDRTGNARSGLQTEVEWHPKVSYSIFLFHTMSYGIWLETRWAGKYAVILPTIKFSGAQTMTMVRGLFSRLRRGGI